MPTLTDEIKYRTFVVDQDRPHSTERKIQGFRELGTDWYYGAEAHFDEAVIQRAIRMNQQAVSLGLFETDAFPGANGEIAVAVYWQDEYLEFIFGAGWICDDYPRKRR